MNDSALDGLLLLGASALGLLLLIRGYFTPIAQGLSSAVTGQTQKVPFNPPLGPDTTFGAGAGATTPTTTSGALASATADITHRVQTITGH